MVENLQLDKQQLRKTLLKTRQELPPALWREKSDRLCTHLSNLALFQTAQTVLAYFSFRQEPDLTPLFSTSKTWGFSRCVSQQLTWHHWFPQSNLDLQIGAFGISEPHPNCPPLLPQEVDLILVPAVGCDRQGYRLGYGGGFYDRMLSQAEWAAKPAIGILFDFAYLPALPVDPWDRPLSAICTESGIKTIAPSCLP
jgi:5-formyltetrahydrofolate cyclo-ligase